MGCEEHLSPDWNALKEDWLIHAMEDFDVDSHCYWFPHLPPVVLLPLQVCPGTREGYEGKIKLS